jgi:hypothetical protein
MNPTEFVEALVRVADSEAADNKPKRDADNAPIDMILSRESEREKKEF